MARPLCFGVITVSDRCATGDAIDKSGPTAVSILFSALQNHNNNSSISKSEEETKTIVQDVFDLLHPVDNNPNKKMENVDKVRPSSRRSVVYNCGVVPDSIPHIQALVKTLCDVEYEESSAALFAGEGENTESDYFAIEQKIKSLRQYLNQGGSKCDSSVSISRTSSLHQPHHQYHDDLAIRGAVSAFRRSSPLVDLLVLTGGTGFAERDVTPEAVMPLLTKAPATGLQYMMTKVSVEATPFGWLSRPCAGVRHNTIIMCLPGNPKAMGEILPPLLNTGLFHIINLARGIPRDDCPQHHQASTCIPPPVQYDIHRENHSNRMNTNTDIRNATILTDTKQSATTKAQEKRGGCSCNRGDHVQNGRDRRASPASMSRISTSVAHRPRHSEYLMLDMKDAYSIIERYSPDILAANGTASESESKAQHETEKHTTESVDVMNGLGRVLATDVRAVFPHPPFRASIKDGYAVVASDGPGVYPVIGAATAGSTNAGHVVQPSQIIRVNTGGLVPDGADAVVQVEDTRLISTRPVLVDQGSNTVSEKNLADEEEEAEVEIAIKVEPGTDIRPIGCDIAAGAVVIPRSRVITPAEVALALSCGVRRFEVYRLPSVAIVSTGDELVALGATDNPARPPHGKIFDSNKGMLMAAARSLFGDGAVAAVIDGGIAADNMASTLEALRIALGKADVVISSGGVSMGEVDCVKRALDQLGATIHFGRVKMKPGKPTTFATFDADNNPFKGKIFFALPGNPVSAMVCFHLFVAPALRRRAGLTRQLNTGANNDCSTMGYAPVIKAKVLGGPIHLDPLRPEYHRCIVRYMHSSHVCGRSNSPKNDADRCKENSDAGVVITALDTMFPPLQLRSSSDVDGFPSVSFSATSTGGQASSRLLSMQEANGMMLLPPCSADRAVVPEGAIVDVVMISTPLM